jgi:DNA modification methylase
MESKLFNGNCIDVMKELPSNSVDLILTDLPYGILNKRTEWDKRIPYDEMWEQTNRISKDISAFITTSKQPFTSELIISNLNSFRYCWIWEKSKSTGYLNSKKMPMVAHEEVVVFYKKMPIYNPQMTKGEPYDKGTAVRDTTHYTEQKKAIHVKNKDGTRYPRSVIYLKTAEDEGKLHPTQKPVKLLEYFINTYSNKNDVVLDIAMGSGTTGVACKNTNRNFIGIEISKEYFKLSQERIKNGMNRHDRLFVFKSPSRFRIYYGSRFV